MCPAVPQKRQSLLSRWCCCSCGVSFQSFPKFWWKVRSGELLLFRSWALALGRARVVVVLLGLGITFARLVVRLVGVRLLFGLCFQKIWSSGFMGEFSFLFPVSCIDKLGRVFGVLWGGRLIVVDTGTKRRTLPWNLSFPDLLETSPNRSLTPTSLTTSLAKVIPSPSRTTTTLALPSARAQLLNRRSSPLLTFHQNLGKIES